MAVVAPLAVAGKAAVEIDVERGRRTQKGDDIMMPRPFVQLKFFTVDAHGAVPGRFWRIAAERVHGVEIIDLVVARLLPRGGHMHGIKRHGVRIDDPPQPRARPEVGKIPRAREQQDGVAPVPLRQIIRRLHRRRSAERDKVAAMLQPVDRNGVKITVVALVYEITHFTASSFQLSAAAAFRAGQPHRPAVSAPLRPFH